VRDRLRGAGERAEREGLRIAVSLVGELRGLAAGVYLMPQFGRLDIAADIVAVARERGVRQP